MLQTCFTLLTRLARRRVILLLIADDVVEILLAGRLSRPPLSEWPAFMLHLRLRHNINISHDID